MLKEFDFIVDTKVDKPVKIARVINGLVEVLLLDIFYTGSP